MTFVWWCQGMVMLYAKLFFMRRIHRPPTNSPHKGLVRRKAPPCHDVIMNWRKTSGEITWNFTWWRHQMETFSALLALCAGNSPVSGEFPAQRPVARSFDVFFDLRLNKRLSKQSWGWWFETPSCPIWRQCNEGLRYKNYDVRVTDLVRHPLLAGIPQGSHLNQVHNRPALWPWSLIRREKGGRKTYCIISWQ